MLPGIQVDPVIIQCYKTSACFATCWLALALTDFTFTPWGILGGLIWVRAAELLKMSFNLNSQVELFISTFKLDR